MLIYLCEDSASDALRLQHHLRSFSKEYLLDFQISSFDSGITLFKDYSSAFVKPDLMFLDIYMDGKNGMDIAKELRHMGYTNGIIFTTSSTEHAMDSYEVNALYYLQKPYTHQDFINAMDRCWHIFKEAQQTFTFRKKGCTCSIPYSDILFFETGQQHTLLLHTTSGTFPFIGSLNQIASTFCQNNNFLPVGRSFIINLNHVAGRLKNDLVMSDNSIVQIPLRKQEYILSIVEHWKQN